MSVVYIAQITHMKSNFVNIKNVYVMNNELKVSFYLKRESRLEKSNKENVEYPIIGKISIGNSIAQFSSKRCVSELLWDVKSGRAKGKSRIAVELNREINKINLSIHHHYKDI